MRRRWTLLGARRRMFKVIKYRKSLINVLGEFPLFAPSSAGAYKAKAPLTILGVNSIVPLLHLLTETVGGGGT